MVGGVYKRRRRCMSRIGGSGDGDRGKRKTTVEEPESLERRLAIPCSEPDNLPDPSQPASFSSSSPDLPASLSPHSHADPHSTRWRSTSTATSTTSSIATRCPDSSPRFHSPSSSSSHSPSSSSSHSHSTPLPPPLPTLIPLPFLLFPLSFYSHSSSSSHSHAASFRSRAKGTE